MIFRRPNGPLRELVASVWLHRAGTRPARTERVLPTGDLDLIVDLSSERSLLAGPSTRPFLLHSAGQGQTIGVVLRVGGAAALLGVPAAELRDTRADLADVWGRAATELEERSLEAAGPEARLDAVERVLSARAARMREPPHPVAAVAAARIARWPERCRIEALGEELGVSARRLEQVFRADVGLTPKAYQRLHRFRRALAGIDRAGEIGWAAFAVERGYYDQSHLIGDFRAHAGLTPPDYLARRGDELNHVPV